jgi:hypothetical protein
VLADVVREYVHDDDLSAICELFEVAPPRDGYLINYIGLARMLVMQSEHGNNRRLLDSLISTTKARCLDRVASTSFERRDYHQAQLERIVAIENELAESGAPAEISVPESRPFAAKSELRQILATAETEVVLVDNYVGPGTLDCLIDVQHPIRLLTGAHSQAVAPGFDRALEDFRREGRLIDVRLHERLHDRHVIFNGRCWLLGSSVKDAGRKTFNMIEIQDARDAVVADVEQKWREGAPYKP